MMMGDQFRSKVDQYSPKSSPRGSRSPIVPRQDSTGTLKTTISLGKNPSIVHSGPFYLMKEPPGPKRLYFHHFRVLLDVDSEGPLSLMALFRPAIHESPILALYSTVVEGENRF